MDINYNVAVRLLDAQGDPIWSEDGWPWGAATRDWPGGDVRPDGHHIRVPANTPPGLYKLTMSLYEPAFAVLMHRLGGQARGAITALTLWGGFASTVFIPFDQFLLDRLDWRETVLVLGLIQLLLGGGCNALAIRGQAATVVSDATNHARTGWPKLRNSEGGRRPSWSNVSVSVARSLPTAANSESTTCSALSRRRTWPANSRFSGGGTRVMSSEPSISRWYACDERINLATCFRS